MISTVGTGTGIVEVVLLDVVVVMLVVGTEVVVGNVTEVLVGLVLDVVKLVLPMPVDVDELVAVVDVVLAGGLVVLLDVLVVVVVLIEWVVAVLADVVVMLVEVVGAVLVVLSFGAVLVVVGSAAQPSGIVGSQASTACGKSVQAVPRRQRSALGLMDAFAEPSGRSSQQTTAPGRPHVELDSHFFTAPRQAFESGATTSASRTQRR